MPQFIKFEYSSPARYAKIFFWQRLFTEIYRFNHRKLSKLWDSIIINLLPIIPESVLPGADKLLPNMMISPPPSSKKTSQETLIDRARAKRLLQSLAEAGLIERDAYKKVIEHYEQKNLIPVK